jgi:hypothetical protein
VQYRIAAPGELAGTGIEVLFLNWALTNDGTVRFFSVRPDFVWRYDLPAGPGAVRQGSPGASLDLAALEKEYQLGLEQRMRSSTGTPQPRDVERVSRLMARLLRATLNKLDPVTTRVVVDDVFNAYTARPGGRTLVAVNTGLLRRVQSADELAFVLAHELGHIDCGHHVLPRDFLDRKGVRDPQIRRWLVDMVEHDADIRAVDIMARAGFRQLDASDGLLSKLPAGRDPSPALRRKFVAWYIAYRYGGPQGATR